MIPHRIEKLAAALAAAELDGILVTEPNSRTYLTGWAMFDAQPGESAYWLLADPNGTTILTGQSNIVEAREAAPGSRLIGLSGGDRRAQPKLIAQLASEAGYRRLGYDDFHLGAGRYFQLRAALSEQIELVPVADLVREIRSVKEPEEIELLREAIRITDNAYVALTEWLKPGTSERQAAWFLEKQMREQCAEDLSFQTIVAAGPGGAVPHHESTDRPIQSGEPVVCDFGAKFHGYCADLTRTFCLGSADDLALEVYEAIMAAHDAGIAALTVGARGYEAAAAAAFEVERRGLPLGHALGHGIGLQVHELPGAHPGNPIVLQENMVITAEPGVYFPGWGGVRVEDDVLVTNDGPVVLNTAPRGLVI